MLNRTYVLCCVLLGAFLVIGAAVSNPALAQCESAKLVASDGAPDDKFGLSVALAGDTAVIGAYLDDDRGMDSGSAYVFQFDGRRWIQASKLLAADGEAEDHFGFAVDVSGETILVGAKLDDDNGENAGAAYVFRFQQTKLLPSDGAVRDYFGVSVALDGDVALVGASRDDDNGDNSGSAYVFRFEDGKWRQEQKLLPSDGQEEEFFGRALAVLGDLAVVGADSDDVNGISSGSAYVFRFDGEKWKEEVKLVPSDGQEFDRFGTAVAVSQENVVIGAPFQDEKADNAGAAYVFRFNARWIQLQKLLPSDETIGGRFGTSVALSDDVLMVGAHREDGDDQRTGSAYLFRRKNRRFFEEAKLTASDGKGDDEFGFAVAVSGDTAVIGAWGDDDKGSSSGSAYVFPLGASCTGRERLVLRCFPRPNAPNNFLKAVVKRGEPNTQQRVCLDGCGHSACKSVKLKPSGRGRVKFRNVPRGSHKVSIPDCGVSQEVDCP